MTPEQINELINKLLETGQILATKSFEIAMQQVKVQIMGYGIALLALIPLLIWIYKSTRKDILASDKDLLIILAMVFHGFQGFFLYCMIARVMNPQWYAIRLLIDTFLNK